MRIPVTLTILTVASVLAVTACGDNEKFWQERLEGKVVANRISRDQLRLYDGAPPTIPHAIGSLGRERCLACHADGAALSSDGLRPAPVTPHPNQINCIQCHVPQLENATFRDSTFVATRPVERPQRTTNPIGPPYIPHRLQDRTDCETCHLGATAVPELVPAHGLRTNCTQCHVRPDTKLGDFVAQTAQP
jgi:cytochrome c-type protein NapB